jgi:hypothetical protein
VPLAAQRWQNNGIVAGIQVNPRATLFPQQFMLAIDLYVTHHNADRKPFIWTATACDVLAKLTRKAALAAR